VYGKEGCGYGAVTIEMIVRMYADVDATWTRCRLRPRRYTEWCEALGIVLHQVLQHTGFFVLASIKPLRSPIQLPTNFIQ